MISSYTLAIRPVRNRLNLGTQILVLFRYRNNRNDRPEMPVVHDFVSKRLPTCDFRQLADALIGLVIAMAVGYIPFNRLHQGRDRI
jgi:hypothetical protein